MKAVFRPGPVFILLLLIAFLTVSGLVPSPGGADEPENTGWLGVSLQRLTSDLREAMDVPSGMGVLIKEVLEDSPAERAGIEVGDVILKYDDKTVTTPRRLSRLVRKTAPGEKVKVQIFRQGKEKTLTVEIEEREWEDETIAFEREFDLHGPPYAICPLLELPHALCRWWGPELWLGVHTVDLTDQLAEYFGIKDGRGVLISEVVEESPAEKAGLEAGDVIIKADGDRVDDTSDLHEVIDEHEEGEEMELVVLRKGKQMKLKATLEERPHFKKSKLYKKLEMLPRKLKRMKVLAPRRDLPEIDVEVEKILEDFQIEDLEMRLESLEEELERIKEKLGMD